MDKLKFSKALLDFVSAVQEKLDREAGENKYRKQQLTMEPGKKNVRIVTQKLDDSYSRSVFCFVDMTNGNVLKANSWKAPHPTPRANIFDPDKGLSGITSFGAKYLK